VTAAAGIEAGAGIALPDEDSDPIEPGLALAAGLLRRIHDLAAPLDFGDLELPPAVGSPQDAERVRLAAALYFAAELESARLLPALELFSGLWASGAFPVDLGPVGPEVVAYHRARHERLTTGEREAIFGRLFGKTYGPDLAGGGGRNTAFEPAMIALAAAISDLDVNASARGPRPADVAAVQQAGDALTENLGRRAIGISAFVTQELLGSIRTALAVFKVRPVQAAVGAHTLWDAVRLIAARYSGEQVDVQSHLVRARSGLELLSWLADGVSAGTAHGLAAPTPEVVGHAVRWLQATLDLYERGQALVGASAWR
jgi:hypothetical protein